MLVFICFTQLSEVTQHFIQHALIQNFPDLEDGDSFPAQT